MKDFWLKIVSDLYEKGKTFSPRGEEIKEIEDYMFSTDNIYNRFFSFKERNLNIKYAMCEFAWYLTGDPNNSMMENYAQLWKKIKNPHPPFWHSNYGEYIFSEKQFDFCLSTLIKDKDSRQACIVINRPSVMMSDTLDKICTYALSFRIRDNKLNCSVNMRSNDFIFGFSAVDFIGFTLVQEILFWNLKDKYPELELGTYTHKADSFHIYKKHFQMLESIYNNKGENFEEINYPKISSKDEANFFMDFLVACELEYRKMNKGIANKFEDIKKDIPENFLFVNWIYNLFTQQIEKI